jgi:cellulose synthase operon protein C
MQFSNHNRSRTTRAALVFSAIFAAYFLLVMACAAAKAPTLQSAGEELKRGNYQQAIAAFNRLLSTNANDAEAQAGLLRAYLETGKYTEAEEAAKKFIAARGDNAAAHLALGEVYAATGRYNEAVSEFGKAGQSSQSATKLRADLKRGETLLTVGKEEEAQPIFQSFVRYYNSGFNANSPRAAEELTLIARALTHLEKFKDANDLYLDAAKADPTFIEAHLGGGELFTEKYNYAEAAEFFADALKINPNSARAHVGVAANKQLTGGAEMGAALEKALSINPNYVEALVLRAGMRLEAEKFEEAKADLDAALKVNPNSLDAHALRAAMYFLQDRAADLDSEIKATLAINPRYGMLYEMLSHYATNHRRYANAVEFSRKAIELSPRLWAAHLSLGQALMRTGKVAEGREHIEISFKGDPFNLWAKNSLDLLDVMKDYPEATRGSFNVKASPKEAAAITPYAFSLLEEVERTLAAKYRFRPRAPIAVEIFENHEDFAVRTLGLPGLGALGVCFGQVVALDSPSARKAGEFNWGSTLWHEYAHVVTLQITDYRIPRWFSEGLSVYEERRARAGWGDDWDVRWLKAFAEGRWFKIADLDSAFLRPKTPEDVPLGYFEASQVCEFITDKYGFDAILDLLTQFKNKAKTGEAIQRVLKLSEADFDREFDAYIRGKVGGYLRAAESLWKNQGVGRLPKEAVLAAVASQPDDFALNLRAGTLLKDENAEKAIAHLKRAVEVFPFYTGEGNAYQLLAELHEKRGDKAAAADALEAMLRVDENDWEAVKKLVQLRLALGDRQRALDALRLSFYINPFDAALHAQAGDLYLQQNEPKQAVNEFQVALALKPANVAEAHYNLSRAHLAAGDKAEARRAVMRSLEAAPSYAQALELLLKLRTP